MSTLRIQDHTRIVRAVTQNPLRVVKRLPLRKFVCNGASPTGADVLRAAMKVPQIDARTKEAMAEVLRLLPAIERGMKRIPAREKKLLKQLLQQIDTAKSPRAALATLTRLQNDEAYGPISVALDLTARLIKDGMSNIYSPNSSHAVFLQANNGGGGGEEGGDEDGGDEKWPVLKADAGGAAAGAMVGVAFEGVGAIPGAAAGAVGASLAQAVEEVLDIIM